ncbi:hypothetical protein HK101_002413 [Irineochytrium annulatum]|nr:hypothetical protein HK101_002413 [Irineochytrium annulatum]
MLHTSGISQLLVAQMLSAWGVDGFLSHTRSVARFYEEKSKVFLESAERHLKGLAEWTAPTAGMFVWFKLVGIRDSSSLITEKAIERKVILVPGFEFFPNPRTTPYVRASFSTASPEEIDTALQRLAEVIREGQNEA